MLNISPVFFSLPKKNAFALFLLLQITVCPQSQASDVEKSGFLSGKVLETKDKVIVKDAVFVVNDKSTAPAIRIEKDDRKRVILSNVRIISNNQTVSDETGNAGIIAIDNSKSRSRVSLRNVKVLARNANISSVSTAQETCAGLICYTQGTHDSTKAVSAAAIGKSHITATQGERPDYRKTTSR
jgi:hypothetical protein